MELYRYDSKKQAQEVFYLEECEVLDYKESYHANNGDLLYDILCLANARGDGDRAIIFGVSDDRTRFPGVGSDEKRKKQQDIADFLRAVGINHRIQFSLEVLKIREVEFDVLKIFNKPEKPYFLTRNYTKGRGIPAGKVVTRDADSNTPRDVYAGDLQIEEMYRERFGIDKTPLERIQIYLRDIGSWQYDYDENMQLYFFYDKFPEFSLANIRESSDGFNEAWVHEFIDNKASRDIFFLRYFGTILKKVLVIWCDGARYATVCPDQKIIEVDDDREFILTYFFTKDSLDCAVNKMFQQVFSRKGGFTPFLGKNDQIFAEFDSQEEAEELLEEDFQNGCKNYRYYYWDKTQEDYFSLENGTPRALLSKRWNK